MVSSFRRTNFLLLGFSMTSVKTLLESLFQMFIMHCNFTVKQHEVEGEITLYGRKTRSCLSEISKHHNG